MKKSLLKSLALTTVAGVFLVAGSALATPTLYLSDGANNVTISDGDASDNLAFLAGVVGWNGQLGNNILSINSGSTKPFYGSSIDPGMTLTSDTTNKSAVNETFTIMFSETDFGPLSGTGFSGWLSSLGVTEFAGFAAGSVDLNVYYDTSNTLFGTGTQIANYSHQVDGGALYQGFSGVPAGPFSLTMIATIYHEGGATSKNSFDAATSAVPEPATMLLFGTGLVGLTGLARRKRTKK